MVTSKKDILRKKMLHQRSALTPQDVSLKSQNIFDRLVHLIQEKNVKVLHTYFPINNEPDTWKIVNWALEKGITIVAPETLPQRKLQHWILKSPDQLQKGLFNTVFPANSHLYHGNIDMILVPGVAFDNNRYRMGYGGGYYDTFLSDHPESFKVGLAYDFQLLQEIPLEPHDAQLDDIITV